MQKAKTFQLAEKLLIYREDFQKDENIENRTSKEIYILGKQPNFFQKLFPLKV